MWPTVSASLVKRTAQLLQLQQEGLGKVKWTDGEANTESGFSALACVACVEVWNEIRSGFPEYTDLDLVANAPDITLTFKKAEVVVYKEKIELKSSKGSLIPGSTIGKLDINTWVISCERGGSGFEIRYGQYYTCMGQGDRDMFQDRTPRPFINFQKLVSPDADAVFMEKEKEGWMDHYAECAVRRLDKKSSWQDWLVEKIIDIWVSRTSVEEFMERKRSVGGGGC